MTPADRCQCDASRGQLQRYPDLKLGQVSGQYPVSSPGGVPLGQQQHPRPFTSLMQGQPGNPTPAIQSQSGGIQASMYSPRGPGNSMTQPRPQLGMPQMIPGQQTSGPVPGQALGQQPGVPKPVPGQLQYHPPLGEHQVHLALFYKHYSTDTSHNLEALHWKNCRQQACVGCRPTQRSSKLQPAHGMTLQAV